MDALPVLCLLLLGVCALTRAVDETVPLPEDLDGSGDDEDFSGSGSGSNGFFVDLESKDVTVFTTSVSSLVPTVEGSTSVSSLVPTVEGSTAAQEPEIVVAEENKPEHTTRSAETTHSPIDDIKEPIAVDIGDDAEVTTIEGTTKEATTSPFQQEETDVEKHHHPHHHHPHHHHTTTSSTTLPSESGGDDDDGTADILPAVDLPEQTTTHIPDTESGLHHVPQELTTPVGDLAKHGVLLEETTSGATSTYVDNEEAAVDPLDNLPALVTTVAEDSRTHEDQHHHHPHHHHHHHHHPTTTTTSPIGELDVEEEVTTKPSNPVEPEVDAEEKSTTVEDVHLHHVHHHDTTTTTSEPEEPYEVHTQNPKGRRVHVPDDGRSTTAVPVISEDEHIPEDAENNDLASTTIQSNISRSPFDENDEISDSKEEGPSGVDEELFFEVTNTGVNEERMNPSSEEGSADSSHGIMERKELLAGIIAGGVAGLAFAAALVVFVLYRMKKKDEGSYSLEEPKQSNGGYQKPREQREFYA